MLILRGAELQEDKVSILLTFDSGETCLLAGADMKNFSQIYKEIVNNFQMKQCRQPGGCSDTGWRPLPNG